MAAGLAQPIDWLGRRQPKRITRCGNRLLQDGCQLAIAPQRGHQIAQMHKENQADDRQDNLEQKAVQHVEQPQGTQNITQHAVGIAGTLLPARHGGRIATQLAGQLG
jgi:hypothetical protein